MLLTVMLVGLLGQIFVDSVACDNPFIPKGKGTAVVTEVVDMINHLGIFPNDHKFLCRVAWVESKYGEAPGTYRQGYYGGIWQVKIIAGKLNLVPFPALFRSKSSFVLSGAVLTTATYRK